MKPFEESDRYRYPLTSKSVIMDIGCYKGRWAVEMARKYGCEIFAFEPIREFYVEAKRSLEPHPNAHLFNFGLGAYDHAAEFIVKGDMTGLHADQGPKERVSIRAIGGWMKEQGLQHVDLAEINIEGGEADLLDAMISEGLLARFAHIQIQPHAVFPGAEERWNKIDGLIRETHDLIYHADWCWSGYTKKSLNRQ